MSHVHVVTQGECLARIAASYAIDWRKIWQHGKNADLRDKRKDPGILLPGDEVFVPTFTAYETDKPTGAVHRFRIRRDEVVVKLRLLFLDQPRANEACVILAGGRRLSRTTDGDGQLEFPVAHDLASCTLVFGEGTADEERMLVSLGRLDPTDTVEGMQARLRNLGFYGGDVDGIAGPRTKAAAAAFAAAHQVSDAPDSAGFAARLAAVHGN